MTTLPPLTTKQQTILKLIYRYRFLDRTQIQALFGHKDKRRVISWLKDLRDKGYVDWRYDATDFFAKAQPAIYYMALNGIRYLRGVGGYPGEELGKRYKDSDRTQIFINAQLRNVVLGNFSNCTTGDEPECLTTHTVISTADTPSDGLARTGLNILLPILLGFGLIGGGIFAYRRRLQQLA